MPVQKPPYRTSMFQRDSRGQIVYDSTGAPVLHRAWGDYFNGLDLGVNSLGLQGTHADRLAYPTTGLADGALFYETDRAVWYVWFQGNWRYQTGTMRGTLTPDQRPTDLGTNDIDLIFYATDTHYQYQWNGTGWDTQRLVPFVGTDLPVYSSNADAVADGKQPGDLYRTGSDPDVMAVVT
jgi:hypothetical protein